MAGKVGEEGWRRRRRDTLREKKVEFLSVPRESSLDMSPS